MRERRGLRTQTRDHVLNLDRMGCRISQVFLDISPLLRTVRCVGLLLEEMANRFCR